MHTMPLQMKRTMKDFHFPLENEIMNNQTRQAISIIKLSFKSYKQLRKDFPENAFYSQHVNAAFSD